MPHHEQTNTLGLSAAPSPAPSAEPSAESPRYISEGDEYFYCFQSLGRSDVVLIGGTKDLDYDLSVLSLAHPSATL